MEVRPTSWLLAISMSLSLYATIALGVESPAIVGPRSVGALLIVGGGATSVEVYETFFQLAGGPNSHLIHIPTATERFESIADKKDYYAEWFDRRKQSFGFVHTRNRLEAESPAFSLPLARATGVWIGGGDQNRLAEMYGGTPVIAHLRAVVERGGVVAGTSSGASIMSDVMVSDETQTSLSVAFGFSLCEQTIVDCHFKERDRLPRMLRLLQRFPSQSGIGIDEKTALLLRGDHAMVLGAGEVTFFSRNVANRQLVRTVLRAGEALQLLPRQPLSEQLVQSDKEPR